jgi:diguanylate cyclase (GGDEF)-like protein
MISMDGTFTGEEVSTRIRQASALLLEVLKSRTFSPGIPEELSQLPEFVELRETLIDFRQFLLAVSIGDLSRSFTRKGHLAGALKSLHAALRHLTWQTKMIASGDFSQRVDFMGEFSEAFNLMVQQLEESRRQLEITSRTDALTGVNNRRHFTELLEAEIERSRRYGSCLSVMMFDLDHFKKVNDTYGHAAGDEALRTFASSLQQSGLRKNDFWGRLGGEEFALALPETGIGNALKPAERIRSTLELTPVRHDQVTFLITVSIGISQYQPGDTIETVLGRADAAMYEAKQTGRNRICRSLPEQSAAQNQMEQVGG